jgi:hypothetical protein
VAGTHLIRGFSGLLIFMAATVAGSAKSRATYIAGHYVAGSPAAEFRPLAEARQLAKAVVASAPGAFVMRGQGQSMQPLYPDGTLLVVQPVPYENLTRGMTVVFQSPDQRSITHVLVAKTADGWRTSGLNNRRADFLPVNARSLRGVVIAAYAVVEGKALALR